jgi:hypothetical protein
MADAEVIVLKLIVIYLATFDEITLKYCIFLRSKLVLEIYQLFSLWVSDVLLKLRPIGAGWVPYQLAFAFDVIAERELGAVCKSSLLAVDCNSAESRNSVRT